MIFSRRLIAVLAGIVMLGLTSAFAGDEDAIWSAVLLATNESQAKAPPAEIAGYHKRLKEMFGYNHFKVIKSHTQEMNNRSESWLLPGKQFSIKVRSREVGDSVYLLRLQLYQKNKLLVNTETRLGSESPLFIKGPLCGKGQLIIVLLIK